MPEIKIGCPHCGQHLTLEQPREEGQTADCPECGGTFTIPAQVAGAPPPPLSHSNSAGAAPTPLVHIPNHLVKSILATIFCFFPLGIPAIVYSAQVGNKLQAGDIQGAARSSDLADKFGTWAIVTGCIGGLLYALIILLDAP